MTDTEPGRGMRCDKGLLKVCEYQRYCTCRLRLPHHHMGRWNEAKWMRRVWRNGAMKFLAGENWRNPEKNLPRLEFVHHENPHEVTETKTRDPSDGGGGGAGSNSLRHRAALTW